MNIPRFITASALVGLVSALLAAPASAQQNAGASALKSPAQLAVARASEEGQYTFLLFHKRDDAATRAMTGVLAEGLREAPMPATSARVLVTSRTEQPLVKKYGVARAPMPLVVAVAPNGAITGVFPTKITTQQIVDAFVTPGMMHSMKAMQEKKLVFVCIHADQVAGTPAMYEEFAADPHYQGRVAIVSVVAGDPAEKLFMEQLEIIPAEHHEMMTAVLAPPAVLVGKFPATATKAEVDAAIVEAGKCCDDPNCKHAKQGK
jgi:hypothetical protein